MIQYDTMFYLKPEKARVTYISSYSDYALYFEDYFYVGTWMLRLITEYGRMFGLKLTVGHSDVNCMVLLIYASYI